MRDLCNFLMPLSHKELPNKLISFLVMQQQNAAASKISFSVLIGPFCLVVAV